MINKTIEERKRSLANAYDLILDSLVNLDSELLIDLSDKIIEELEERY